MTFMPLALRATLKTEVAGRSINFLAGRDICDTNLNSTLSASDCGTVVDIRIIYGVVISLVSIIGLALSAFLIIRQRRAWRRKQELGQIFIPPRPNPSDPPYDPSVGRPVQNVGPGAPQPTYVAPPPTYSAV
jgi:hypothetical protein